MEILKEIFLYDSNNPMLFNSGIFFVLFAVFIITYTAIHRKRIAVSLFVIFFSFFFYYKSSGIYFLILAFTSVTDYIFAILISKSERKKNKRLWLVLSVGSSLAILAFFKYTNFFLENLQNLLQIVCSSPSTTNWVANAEMPVLKSFSEIAANNFQPLDIFLPIGISFYTFQSISYVLDVYRKKLEPTRNFLDYVFYLSFFPQLVAGPIVKANLFLPQLNKRIKIGKEMIWGGMWLIMLGLFKKAVVADYISQYNDFVFAAPHTYSGFENLMAVLGYTLQIYCDFSGYSDMAIGLAMVMGFDLGINFNFPYKALNITDFWRRWHISLSSWLRDYLYIPLGGNRKGKIKMYRNLFLTMFLGGLWHGANWKFVVWGTMHGGALALHKASKKTLDKIPNNLWIKSFSWLITFIFVATLWIFFRVNDISENQFVCHVKDGKNYKLTSKTIKQTDSTKTVRLDFKQNDISKYTKTAVLKFKEGSKIRISQKNEENDAEVSVDIMMNAYKVAFIMIKKILTQTTLEYVVPFWNAHRLWVILILIGFMMHATPIKWTNKISNWYINSHFLIKLILFVITVQLVIQFQNEDIQPFIYFQF